MKLYDIAFYVLLGVSIAAIAAVLPEENGLLDSIVLVVSQTPLLFILWKIRKRLKNHD